MIVWANPEAFLLFPVLILMALWQWKNRHQRAASFQFSTIRWMRASHPGFRRWLAPLPGLFKYGGLSLVIIALARPQLADTKVKRTVEGIDIMIALDISDSMTIEDMVPTDRLEASKQTIQNFIEKRVSDRIGLLVFSGESYTRVPLTLDYPLLIENLKQVQTSDNIKMGTAIGVALSNAVLRLRDSTAKSRVVVFLTDGENNTGTIDPETALDIAKQDGVRIYSIGMGKDGPTRIPVYSTDAFGRKYKRYRPILSKINEALLGQLASETGGKYYRAITTDALQRVFNDINQLETTKIESSQFTRYSELFQNYLLIGLLFYALSLALSHSWLYRGP